jgi:hypothetical protein
MEFGGGTKRHVTDMDRDFSVRMRSCSFAGFLIDRLARLPGAAPPVPALPRSGANCLSGVA